MASLLLKGSRIGNRVVLKPERNLLGRDGKCDVVMSDAFLQVKDQRRVTISRKHAVITYLAGNYYIEDGDGEGTPSRNGTFLNEKRLPFPSRHILENRDQIRFCDFTMLFLDDDVELISVEASLSQDTSVVAMRSQSSEKLNTILELTNRLSNTFEVDAIHERIAEGLFELFLHSERCFIITRESLSAPLGFMVKTRIQSEKGDATFCSSIVNRCLENCEAILGNDLTKQFPNSDSILEMNAHSIMCAPLWAQNRQPIGAIQLDMHESGVKFNEMDLKLLLGVAGQASIALSNVRLHRDLLTLRERERDLELAHQVQLALLPQSLPEIPGYRFFAYYEAAQQIGGDYYDFISLPNQRLAILLGDVVGKGAPAALLMAKFSVEARVCLENEADLAAAITKLNAIMAASTLADRFITMVAIVLDLAQHLATIVNAGHPSPLILRHDGKAVEEAAPVPVSGLPISVDEQFCYTSSDVQLLPGDELILYTDGLTDAMNAEERFFGMGGIHSVLRSAPDADCEIGPRLLQSVKQHAHGHHQSDDLTLVTLCRTDTPT